MVGGLRGDHGDGMIGGGWMGTVGQLMHTLGVVGCDRDEHGAFIVRGSISAFMGDWSDGSDVVVGADADYRVGDHWASVAGLLGSTSYGLLAPRSGPAWAEGDSLTCGHLDTEHESVGLADGDACADPFGDTIFPDWETIAGLAS